MQIILLLTLTTLNMFAYTPSESVSHSNVYLCPKMNMIDKVENIKDLGITMPSNCNFN